MSYIDEELAFLRRHPQVVYANLVGSTAVLGEGKDGRTLDNSHIGVMEYGR